MGERVMRCWPGCKGVDLVRFKEDFPSFENSLRVQWDLHFCWSKDQGTYC